MAVVTNKFVLSSGAEQIRVVAESTDSAAWSLHPQLEQDTLPLGDLPLSRVLLMNDANYPWLILVPRRAGVTEIIDLDAATRDLLMQEIGQTSSALRSVTGCHKLNVAALGNVVAQLHVHVIARFQSDPTWPRPVWGQVAARPYESDAARRAVASLRQALGL
jgi:diadenosine tetraphosphate (Ap4A) HIT family hydrolase